MDDTREILRIASQIESILEADFGGSGRGLHEKLTNSTGVPDALAKRIRYVATIRNKLAHEYDFELDDPQAFKATCNNIVSELEALRRERQAAQARAESQSRAGATYPGMKRGPAHGMPESKQLISWPRMAGIVLCCVLVVYLLMPPKDDVPESAPHPVTQVASPVATPETVAQAAGNTMATPPTETVTTPELPKRPQRLQKKAVPPAKKHAPAAVRSGAAGTESVPATAGSSAIASESSSVTGKIGLGNLQLVYAPGGFRSTTASIKVTVTNHTGETLSSMRFAARLYINGGAQPVVAVGEGRGGMGLYAFFGDNGLLDGATTTTTIYVDTFGNGAWTLPDVLNASSRKLEIAAIACSDGLKNDMKCKTPFVTYRSGTDPVVPAPKGHATATQGPVISMGDVHLKVGAGPFGGSTITARFTNNTGVTLSSASLAARLYLDGQDKPVLVVPTQGYSGGFGGSLYVGFGDRGLAAGATRTETIYISGFDSSKWSSPTVRNATTRRVELAVMEYRDGLENSKTVARSLTSAKWQE